MSCPLDWMVASGRGGGTKKERQNSAKHQLEERLLDQPEMLVERVSLI